MTEQTQYYIYVQVYDINSPEKEPYKDLKYYIWLFLDYHSGLKNLMISIDLRLDQDEKILELKIDPLFFDIFNELRSIRIVDQMFTNFQIWKLTKDSSVWNKRLEQDEPFQGDELYVYEGSFFDDIFYFD